MIPANTLQSVLCTSLNWVVTLAATNAALSASLLMGLCRACATPMALLPLAGMTLYSLLTIMLCFRRLKGWALLLLTKVRERIRRITARHACQMRLETVLGQLSLLLRGWGEYFRTGNATRKFLAIDRYVWRRLAILERHRRNWNQGRHLGRFRYDWYAGLPLYRLPGTIRYPKASNVG